MAQNSEQKAPGQLEAEEHANLASILLVDAVEAEGPRKQKLVKEAREHLNQVISWVCETPKAPPEALVAVLEISANLKLFDSSAAN